MNLSKETIEAILSDYSKGYTIDRIRAERKRSEKTIKTVLIQNGFNIEVSKKVTNLQLTKWFEKGLTIESISNELQIKEDTVQKWLKILGLIKPKFSHLSESTKLKIQELYNQGLSSRKVADELGIAKVTVLDYIDNARPSSSFRVHEEPIHKFKELNTPELAYWFGFLVADGYNNEQRNQITIGQAEKDKQLVYNWKSFMQVTNKISIKEGVDNIQTFYSMVITSKELSYNLSKLGCGQAKTHITKYPDIHGDLDKHFIRGYFEGDGGMWLNNKKHLRLSITGNIELIKQIQTKLIDNVGINRNPLYPRRPIKSPNIVDIRIGGNVIVKKVMNWLYKDIPSTMRFDRKYNISQSVLTAEEKRNLKTLNKE